MNILRLFLDEGRGERVKEIIYSCSIINVYSRSVNLVCMKRGIYKKWIFFEKTNHSTLLLIDNFFFFAFRDKRTKIATILWFNQMYRICLWFNVLVFYWISLFLKILVFNLAGHVALVAVIRNKLRLCIVLWKLMKRTYHNNP